MDDSPGSFLCSACHTLLHRLRIKRAAQEAQQPPRVLAASASLPLSTYTLPAFDQRTPPRASTHSFRLRTPRATCETQLSASFGLVDDESSPSHLNGAVLFSGEKVQALISHVRCPTCDVDMRLASHAPRDGGGRDLTLQCPAGHTQVMRTTLTLPRGRPPVPDREAFVIVAQHLLAGETHAAYARNTRCNMQPVSLAAYAEMLSYMLPSLLRVRSEQRLQLLRRINARPAQDMGSSKKLLIAHDMAWHKRSKKNHCGDSPHAVYFLLDLLDGGVLESVIVSKLGVPALEIDAFTGSSQAMEDAAHRTCLQQFRKAYPTLQVHASVKDGDVAMLRAHQQKSQDWCTTEVHPDWSATMYNICTFVVISSRF